jgi:hypothetical protein
MKISNSLFSFQDSWDLYYRSYKKNVKKVNKDNCEKFRSNPEEQERR